MAVLAIICTPLYSFSQAIPSEWLETLEYRFAGPFRGGRATAATGVPGQPFVFYAGYTGGGVWKTDDAGNSWTNISDSGIECGSIGSIAVSHRAPETILVGTGSDSPRGNVSPGVGMYKTIDGGENWKKVGMEKCGQIGDIVYDPHDPNVVYAAALGNIFGPNKERGVYKSTDGGDSWEQVFFLNDTTGAVDLAIHPENSAIIYAGMWRAERKPWTLIDGGETGGLYRSVDAGKNWERITNGLPEGLIGKIGVDISPVNPKRIWVIQQTAAEEAGGVYRSDDGGASFKRINRDHKLRQRGWYYSRIFADPQNENTVYVTNTGFYKSIDGGKTFDTRFGVPHGDCHAVWINPDNPDIFINTNDGGATITLNGGRTWTTQNNQPTAEFYRLTVDNQFPYRLYAGQQDNTTISIPSRVSGGLDAKQHWYEVGGGESADVAVHPTDPDIVYATTYSGIITRINRKTDEYRDVGAYPHYTEGTEQRKLKYRWQWNFPIRVSRHDPTVIYHTSNYVHRSTDEGQNWQLISPDLTNKLDKYHGIPGGPIQHDATGVEVYSTIFSFEEDPHDARTLWVGSDDGRIQLTRNGGKDWQDITPKNMPAEGTVNAICPSAHQAGKAYAVVYRYRDNDFKPYIFKTENYGKNWEKITNGIPDGHFVRAIDEDEEMTGLLFAGTEFGIYYSMDDGANWQTLQRNLPYTPITDLEVHRGDLVISTQGRGFWIMDDISLLRELKRESKSASVQLFPLADTYRTNLGWSEGGYSPYRANIRFYLEEVDSSEKVELSILDARGEEIQSWWTGAEEKEEQLEVEAGINQVEWDQSYPRPELVPDLMMMDMRYPGEGPQAAPGKYTVRLRVGEKEFTQDFNILKDPRWEVSDRDLLANFKLAFDVAALLTESQRRLQNLRAIREQIGQTNKNLTSRDEFPQLREAGKKLSDRALELEDMIYQRQIETSQDEINYPRKFTNHLIRLYRVVISQNDQPSAGELERWTDLQREYQPFDEAYQKLIREELPAYQAAIEEEDIPYILLPKK
ncbi:glycosyl hydrolase [Flavilitoribacter nigricans DSM 23189 = NBRC 102662]|uniref:Glycosyl hydrolase n=1 Tax=Flavilitoribacter nigricans (strain ATCC 23147 / DSM 23189 / NBRC 102662 / NCIMB 1420 / SS-2) TaxID=1122177 RepID=A0A2D0N3W3_FLAN2|nr:glycosyl hydrolase [Flavilitoribacter nigricans DSM 23189 = NBRC 102662]